MNQYQVFKHGDHGYHQEFLATVKINPKVDDTFYGMATRRIETMYEIQHEEGSDGVNEFTDEQQSELFSVVEDFQVGYLLAEFYRSDIYQWIEENRHPECEVHLGVDFDCYTAAKNMPEYWVTISTDDNDLATLFKLTWM